MVAIEVGSRWINEVGSVFQVTEVEGDRVKVRRVQWLSTGESYWWNILTLTVFHKRVY